MPDLSSPREAIALLRPGMRVFLGGCAGEPSAFLEALARDPDRGAGVTFTGVFIPGVNRVDPYAMPSGSRLETFFVTPQMQAGFRAGRVSLLPMHYSAIVRRFATPEALALAVTRVSPPNREGMVSFGVAADFSPDIARLPIPLVAEIDPAMPFVADGPVLPIGRFAVAYEAAGTLPDYEAGRLSPALRRIGETIAGLLEPGDTLQLGLGKAQKAVLEALHGKRGLAYHGGMIIDEILPLVETGVIERVTTGVALGGPALIERCRDDAAIRFRPVSFTHDHARLAAIPDFVTVNAALTVDLSGASVSDVLDGEQISGIGGLADFHRGAMASQGGRPIIALASTTSDGSASRIVPRFPDHGAASLARADAGIIVTEHGLADCRGLDLDARARAIIAIADPRHRDALTAAWRNGQGERTRA
jgi:acyl-CoA hydrolase